MQLGARPSDHSNSVIGNKGVQSILVELGVSRSNSTGLNIIADSQNRYTKDLAANILHALNNEALSPKESALIGLSTSINDKSKDGIAIFTNLSKNRGATPKEIAEVYSSTSLLSLNNAFYHFRHAANKDYYLNSPAGIKMTVVGKPVLGKEFFELLSLSVSALNGCDECIRSHEKTALHHGSSESRIYEAVRTAAIFRSLIVLL